MIYLKTEEEIELLREADLVVARTLGELAKWVAPGITTRRLDQIAEEYIRSQHCTPGFLGLYGYPATLCISVNEVVIHGMPSSYALEDGDIVSIDCGAVTEAGFNGDSTYTFCVGDVDDDVKQLLVDGTEFRIKSGEQLNTDLRVLCCIRLGITDSAKIASFLRYSLSTIFNARTRMRNLAKGDRDSFEKKVAML